MKKILYILFLSIFFISCEEVIDLELPESEPKLVIDASINKLYSSTECTDCYVKLTLSSPYYNEEVIPVTDAEVKILDITNGREFLFEDNNNDGTYISTFDSFLRTFHPEFNTEYKLQIIYEDEVYESIIEQLIPTSPIDSLEQSDGTLFEGDEKEVIISYTDVANRDDFYLFDLDEGFYLTSKDEFYQGNPFSFSYFYDNDTEGEELFIKIFGISESYYNYMNILLNQIDNTGNPFGTTPTNVMGNITNITNPDNQPLGYFRIAEFDEKSIIVE